MLGRISVIAAFVALVAGSGLAVAQEKLDFGLGSATVSSTANWRLADGQDGARFAHRLLSPTHSIVALVEPYKDLDNNTAYLLLSQPDQVLKWQLEMEQKGSADGRIRVQDFAELPRDLTGAMCRGYRFAAVDTGVRDDQGNAYTLRAIGVWCVLGKYPALVRVEYSERHQPSEADHPGFEAEAEQFLTSVVFR